MKVSVFMTAIGLLAPFTAVFAGTTADVRSPDDRVRFKLSAGDGRLEFSILFADRPVIAASPLGILVDGVDLGRPAEIEKVETYEANESYPTRGVHSRAVNHFRGARVTVRHPASRSEFTIDIRAFNDGVAFRHIVPGGNLERVADESTRFRLVPGSTVWYHDLRGHYEGVHVRKPIGDVKLGEWAAPPLTIVLPEGRGFAAITEGALAGYAGLALQADGDSGFITRLGHSHPASHPFTLRYGAGEAERLAKAAAIKGDIIWA